MLETLVTSKTRRKLLLKFFLNSSIRSYLRELEAEFGESTNSIRLELNRFEEAGMLLSSFERNKKIFRANTDHLLFYEIQKILMKYTGIEQLTETVLSRIFGLRQAWVTGDIALGRDNNTIELLVSGDDINLTALQGHIDRAEMIIGKKIRYTWLKEENKGVVEANYPERMLVFWKMTNDRGYRRRGSDFRYTPEKHRKPGITQINTKQ